MSGELRRGRGISTRERFQARAQPVFVDDVAKAVVSAVCDPSTAGKTYSLAGPGIYTQAELAQIVFDGTPEERSRCEEAASSQP